MMNRGAFAAIIRDDTVLLVRSLTTPEYIDHWSSPGGIVEQGESLQEALTLPLAYNIESVLKALSFNPKNDNA